MEAVKHLPALDVPIFPLKLPFVSVGSVCLQSVTVHITTAFRVAVREKLLPEWTWTIANKQNKTKQEKKKKARALNRDGIFICASFDPASKSKLIARCRFCTDNGKYFPFKLPL